MLLEIDSQNQTKTLPKFEQLKEIEGYINVRKEIGEEVAEEWIEDVSSETESCHFPEYSKCFILRRCSSGGGWMLICEW